MSFISKRLFIFGMYTFSQNENKKKFQNYRCKDNVRGRTCDHCQAGYFAFPNCQECSCDLRGTTEDVCDDVTSTCFCKNNVYGLNCDLCKDGTFYLSEKNPNGCTKCFCFGKTTRCSISNLYKSHVS